MLCSPGQAQEIPSWKQKSFWLSGGSCKLDTYPRGHRWGASVFQTTPGHRRKSSHISHKDFSFGNTPCSSSHPLQILLPRSHFSKSLQKSEQGACNEGCCLCFQEGARATPEGLDQILGKISALKGMSSSGTCCPGHSTGVESPSPEGLKRCRDVAFRDRV